MKNYVLIGAVIMTAAISQAATNLPLVATQVARKTRCLSGMSLLEQYNCRGYKRTGGGVVKPGTEKGLIVFANSQNRVPESEIIAFRKRIFHDIAEFNMRVEKTPVQVDAVSVKASSKANVVILLKDDPNLPTSLVASEDHWAMVNIAKLAIGYKGKEVSPDVLATRTRKELIRIFCALCGGASQFEGNLLSASSVEALDSLEEFIPVDLKYRVVHYLEKIGVSAACVRTYQKACQEGWAPAPTNAIQKAIWDKVHALPTEPIKIKPETKKMQK